MKKNIILTVLTLLFIGNISAQIKKEVKIKDFTEFKLEGSSTVYLIPSDTTKLVAQVKKDAVLDYLKITNEGGKLIINTTDKNKNASNTFSKLVFYVYFKDLHTVILEGKGKIVTMDTIKADIFVAELRGSGNLDLMISCNYFKAGMDGTGTFKVSGIASESKVDVSGVGSYKAYGLITKNTEIELNGVGKAQVYASESIDAELNGVGNIKYKGNPKTKHLEASGVGNIKSVE